VGGLQAASQYASLRIFLIQLQLVRPRRIPSIGILIFRLNDENVPTDAS